MRYALLADIHGNLPALRAVLAEARRCGVDGYLMLGDLVGYGADPNACVELVAELDPVGVAGNHDLIALGRLSDERCIPLARVSLAWTRDVLRDDVRAYLEALPLRRAASGGVVIAHGSLDDPQCYVRSSAQASGQLRQLREEEPAARVLALGHTHFPLAAMTSGLLSTRRPLELAEDRLLLVNPGAVGQSRDLRVRARFGILDLESRLIRFMAVPYDVESCRAASRAAGLSAESYHLRPSPARVAVRAVRGITERSRRIVAQRRAKRAERARS